MASGKNGLKHLFWIIPLLLIFCAAAYIFYRYKTFDKPVVTDVSTDILLTEKNKTALLTSTVFIANTNDISIHADSARYVFFLEGREYGGGSLPEGFTIKANDTSSVNIPFTYDLKKFIQQFEKTGKDSAVVTIKGDLYVDAWIFNSIHIPFTFEKKIPVVKALHPEIEKVELKKLGLNETIVEATLNFHNPNKISLETDKISYTFTLGDAVIAEGNIEHDEIFPIEGNSTVTVPIKIDLKEAIEEVGIFRKKYEGKPYELRIHILMNKKTAEAPRSDFDLIKKGTADELIDKLKDQKKKKKEEKKNEK